MEKSGEEFRKKLLATFREEAREHVRELNGGLLKFEAPDFSGPPDEVLENVFRAAHSLKGAARAVDERETERLCQALESVLARLKRTKAAPDAGLLDLLLEGVRTAGELAAAAGAPEPDPALRRRAAETAEKLEDAEPDAARPAAGAGPERRPDAPARPADPAPAETVRVPLAALESLLRQTEEMLACKLAAGQRCAEVKDLISAAAAPGAERSGALREADGQDAEEALRARLAGTVKAQKALLRALEQDRRALASRVDRLHDEMKQTMMLPFATLLEGFPLFLRELLRSQGKEAAVTLEGADLAVDRRILQEMKDPLTHLARNAVDHGIEKPEERIRNGKAPRGAITIAVSKKEGNKAEITIADDGAGIDAQKVLSAAVRLGAAEAGAEQKDAATQAEALIFRSGLSTSPVITPISGRGLGLAIVREKVERLGGTAAAESAPGRTVFRVTLPLTVSTLRGILVQSGGETLAVPISQVERVGKAGPGEIRTVEGKTVLSCGGRTLSLWTLSERLGLTGAARSGAAAAPVQYVVAVSGGDRAAFLVDQVVMEQELLVKGLGTPLARVRGASGAAVLGSGKVVAILNMRDLLESAGEDAAPAQTAAARKAAGPELRKTVLVAEDSITARALLKNIFEAAGYEVRTAVDGAAAFELLRSGPCDVLVSDVDMPRLNGFELTERIRADKNLSDLPVVLVTALASDSDRQKGIESGANAYIVKSSFEQNDILEIVGRLV